MVFANSGPGFEQQSDRRFLATVRPLKKFHNSLNCAEEPFSSYSIGERENLNIRHCASSSRFLCTSGGSSSLTASRLRCCHQERAQAGADEVRKSVEDLLSCAGRVSDGR